MAPPSLAIIILAAGPEIWAFPSWKTRTKEVLLPFYPDATSDSTGLQSWQLTLLRKFARRIRDIDNYRGRMKYIQHGHKSDPRLLHAPDIWTAWLNPLLESWNIVTDVEDILIKFHRHPSQLQPLPERVSLVSPFPRYIFDPQNPLGSSPFKEKYVGNVLHIVAECLFGDDTYVDPTVLHPFIKHDLIEFTFDLLTLVWNSALPPT